MGTHHRGTKTEIRALNAFITLMRAAETVAARLGRVLAARGLTGSQFGVLETLLHLGPLCQRELGEKLLRSGGNVTLVVDNLEKRGLVARQRGDGDRRKVTVHLAREGRRLIGALFPQTVPHIVREMSVLSAAEQETLRRFCRRLGHQDEAVEPRRRRRRGRES